MMMVGGTLIHQEFSFPWIFVSAVQTEGCFAFSSFQGADVQMQSRRLRGLQVIRWERFPSLLFLGKPV